MRDSVDAACRSRASPHPTIAPASPSGSARPRFPDLALFHPWDLPVERAIEVAKAAEDAGFAAGRHRQSEGRRSPLRIPVFYGNSLGFLAGYPNSRHGGGSHSFGKGDEMQRDDWYETARDPLDCRPRRSSDARRARGPDASAPASADTHARSFSKRRSPPVCSGTSSRR